MKARDRRLLVFAVIAGAGATHAFPAAAQVAPPGHDRFVRILPFEDPLLFGRVTARALAGSEVAAVEFFTDGQLAARARSSPFEAALRLPPLPEPVSVEAVGLDSRGQVVGRDRMRVNLGHGEFAVRILPFEFHGAGEYAVDLEVDVPYGEAPPTVELSWNEQRLGALDGPPYQAAVQLPAERGYLKAVARRANGEVQEAAVVRSRHGYAFDSDVDLVELYAVARGPDGELVRDLEPSEVRLEEDGESQQIRTLESGDQAALTVSLALDVSSSMTSHLETIRAAALRFVESVLGPRDRALLVAFSGRPELLEPPTGDRARIARALAQIEIAGGTALWDSLVFSLIQLRGLPGRKAVVVLTDGRDQGSRLSLQLAGEYARRAGIPIYLMRLRTVDGAPPDPTELLLSRLVHTSGGSESLLRDIDELDHVYRGIAAELRGQYVISYQSSSPPETGWRTVKLEVERPGVRVRTRTLVGSARSRGSIEP